MSTLAALPRAVRALLTSGVLAPERPDRLAAMGLAYARWGATPAAAYAVAAVRVPDRPAVIDEREQVSFAELHRRSNAVARGLARLGVHRGDTVALLARNSAQFVLAQTAAAKLGADLVYLNTGFAAPQLAEVLRAENAALVIADEEFSALLDEAAPARPRVLAWCDAQNADAPSLAALARAEDDSDLLPPGREGRHVLLTSGTTGKPKGAVRAAPSGLAAIEPLIALAGTIPVRARETTVLASPMFHAWGFAHLTMSMVLESTLVVRRRFDPRGTLELIDSHAATVLAAVPVMLQRLLELPEEVLDGYRLASLRAVALSGSALPPDVAARWSDRFGANLYDLYGSTEVAYVSLATPQDMAEAPGSVGHPLPGVRLRLVDEDGRDVPPGETGRIFVGSAMTFGGYTGGADKERLDGLVATGDVGHLDGSGRLYVDGRSDDMIVSGGENVFPGEVEDTLRAHPGVADVAVVGVPDEEFGERLVAHVVRREGASVDEDALRRHVRSSLAGYKVPREVVFHDELPRNETGKVVKRRLPGQPDGAT